MVAEGWKDRPTKNKKGHYNSELVPRELVVARYLAPEQEKVEVAAAALEEATQVREALEEEYAGEEGVLSDYAPAGKLDRKAVAKRLKAAGPASGSGQRGRKKAGATTGTMFAEQEAAEAPALSVDEEAEELAAVRAVGAALEAEDDAKKHLDQANATLEAGLAKQYLSLTPDDVRTLVVDDKWLASLHGGLSHELARLSGTLARRLTELAQRYAQPLPALEADVAAHQARVDGYLAKMGFSLN